MKTNNGPNRARLSFVLLIGISALARAQDVPGASLVPLDELIANIGNQFGIAVTSEKPLDELVYVPSGRMAVSSALSRLLSRHSYLLVYSGHWHGSLAESPNRLHIFADVSSGVPRAVRSLSRRTREVKLQAERIDEISLVDEIIVTASDEYRDKGVALALEFDAADNPFVREEILFAAADIDSPASIEILSRALTDESVRVREAAVDAIADSKFANQRSLLQLALADPDIAVREAAAYAMERRP